ncbi:MAG TPA: hypothetical protein VGG99_15210 [Acetobacteraceae bacterium]|jgi:hypothetical protein
MQWLRSGSFALSVAAVLSSAPNPAAATTFLWQIQGGIGTNLFGEGTLQTSPASGGGSAIVAFDGSIAGLQVSLLGGDPGGITVSPSGAFNYDNVFYPTAAAVLDSHGVLLSVAGEEGNIWSNGVPGSYSYWRGEGPSYDYSDSEVTFSILPAIPITQQTTGDDPPAVSEPAPASWLAVAGLALGAVARFRKRRQPPAPPAG